MLSDHARIWPRFLPVLLLLFGCIPYCEWGGGVSANSVTVPGVDGVFVKAEAAAGERVARLELVRTTREVTRKGEVSYVFAKTLVEQQLRLIVGTGEDATTFVVAEHDAASSFPTYRLEFSPDGDRLAYQLGEDDWQVVYLLTNDHAVHGPGGYAALQWSAIPTLDEAFVDVYKAQMLALDGKFDFNRKPLLLTWADMRGGDAGLAERLFDLIVLRDHAWDTQFLAAREAVKTRLRERLRAVVLGGAATADHWSKAWTIGAVQLNEPRDVAFAGPGARSLAASEEALRGDGLDLAAYLGTWARQDVAAAAAVACTLVRPKDAPLAVGAGRPAQLAALATLVVAEAPCPAVDELAVDPCAPDVRCGAQACVPEQLTPIAREVLNRRYDGVAWATEDTATAARLVLAHRLAMGAGAPAACPD